MKNLLASALLAIILTSCGITYGNKKIADMSNVNKVNVGDKASDLDRFIGSPSKVYKEGENKIYEYNYHTASRSGIYYVPLVSVVYYAFAQNPFSMERTVRSSVDHSYLFLTIGSDGKVKEKNFYQDSAVVHLPQSICSANNIGMTTCVSSNNKTFAY
jgi:hypothetical protein